jgi:hypothetical protein
LGEKYFISLTISEGIPGIKSRETTYWRIQGFLSKQDYQLFSGIAFLSNGEEFN